jgi:hypothetical protein
MNRKYCSLFVLALTYSHMNLAMDATELAQPISVKKLHPHMSQLFLPSGNKNIGDWELYSLDKDGKYKAIDHEGKQLKTHKLIDKLPFSSKNPVTASLRLCKQDHSYSIVYDHNGCTIMEPSFTSQQLVTLQNLKETSNQNFVLWNKKKQAFLRLNIEIKNENYIEQMRQLDDLVASLQNRFEQAEQKIVIISGERDNLKSANRQLLEKEQKNETMIQELLAKKAERDKQFQEQLATEPTKNLLGTNESLLEGTNQENTQAKQFAFSGKMRFLVYSALVILLCGYLINASRAAKVQ